MKTFEIFMDFYHELDGLGIAILWLLIFFFFFFMVVSICLIFKNKELRNLLDDKIVKEKELEAQLSVIKQLQKDKPLHNNCHQPTPSKIQEPEPVKISEPPIINNEEKTPSVNITIPNNSAPSQGEVATNNYKKEELYQNNSLKGNSKRYQTSPINIVREKESPVTQETQLPTNNNKVTNKTKVSNTPSELPHNNRAGAKDFEKSSNISFVEELSRKMEQEVKPQTIELTDYEQKQEDEAIISYEELMQNKDRLYNITDDEDDDGFIEELKYFRQSLQ